MTLIGVIVGLVLVTVAGSAAATARRPRVLATEPGTSFLVRPASMTFDETNMPGGTFDYILGPGISVRAWRHGAHGAIRWQRYGSRAVARGTFLTQECDSLRGKILSCSQSYLASQARLTFSRVRNGRYTRFVITLLGKGYSTSLPTYGLRKIRLKSNGQPHGEPADSWCAVADRSACAHP